MKFYFNSFKKSHFFQVLALYLVFSLISFPLLAQQQRRGLFLQDEVSRSGSREGVSEQDLQDYSLDSDLGQSGTMSGSGMNFQRPGMIYQVHVLGEVRRPGTYRVSPSMRVTDAIRRAGGILRNGSERFVALRKSGQKRGKSLDLFAYKILGQVSQNPYLRDNDTVFISLKKKAVEIEGPVRRPGVYELKNEKNLFDLVNLAGGFTVGAHQESPIKIIRYHDQENKEIIEIAKDRVSMKEFMLQDGDFAVVQHKFLTKHQFDYNLRELPNDNIFYPAHDNQVFVIGGVKRPGAFPFNQYYSLRQYMTLAGGTTVMAKKKKIKLVRVDGTTIKAKRGNYDGVINPGDTIVIPEKSIPNQFYIGLMTTLVSLGISSYAIFR